MRYVYATDQNACQAQRTDIFILLKRSYWKFI